MALHDAPTATAASTPAATRRPSSAPSASPRPTPAPTSRPSTASTSRSDPGEIFGLLGPNGAGKTTTAGMLTTRVIPTGGTALHRRHRRRRPPRAGQAAHRRRLPAEHARPPAQRVGEPLLPRPPVRHLRHASRKRLAAELLERFHLAKWAKASVYALSGGMAQRLMVARAIMHRPAVLFLDEPTAGLDPQSRLALWEILGELHADGQTILLTTHYMEEADQLCERVAIMDHGRILALDTPAALKASVGADTVVTVQGRRRPWTLAEDRLAAEVEGVTRFREVDGTASSCTSPASSASCPGSSPPPSGRASTSSTSPSPRRPSRPSSST